MSSQQSGQDLALDHNCVHVTLAIEKTQHPVMPDYLLELVTWRNMRGYTVEEILTVVSHVNNHLTELVTWKDMRGYTVEKSLTSVGHVKSYLPKLANWKDMRVYIFIHYKRILTVITQLKVSSAAACVRRVSSSKVQIWATIRWSNHHHQMSLIVFSCF